MKRDTLVMMSALILVALLGSLMAFNAAMGQQEERVAELVALREKESAAFQAEIAGLQEELVKEMTPQSYSLPLEQMWISSGAGYRKNPMGGTEEKLHKGIDLVADVGTPVKAFRGGIVSEHWPAPDARWSGHPVMGGYITLYHGDCYSLYGHLGATFVHTGDRVAEGQVIGTVGNTGLSTGNHLHFEIVVDPLFWVEEE